MALYRISYIVNSTFYIVHCTFYIVHSTSYILHRKLYLVSFTPISVSLVYLVPPARSRYCASPEASINH